MAAHQAPPSLGFSRQEHWTGLPFPSPMHESEKGKWSHSVMSDPQQPHGLQPTRLLHPWDFPGRSNGVGCHCLLRWTAKSSLKPVFINKVLLKYSHAYSLICCSHAIVVDLNSRRDLTAHQSEILTLCLCEPLLWIMDDCFQKLVILDHWHHLSS